MPRKMVLRMLYGLVVVSILFLLLLLNSIWKGVPKSAVVSPAEYNVPAFPILPVIRPSTGACDEKQFLAYQCHTQWCGGLGDRQKGIAMAFLVALLSNRTFVLLDSLEPCGMGDFMEPNVYDWRQCKDYIKNLPEDDLQYIGMGKIALRDMNIHSVQFNDVWTRTAVVVEPNGFNMTGIRAHPDAERLLCWIKYYPDHSVFSIVLRILFKPVPKLNDHINQYLKMNAYGRQTVCVHIRTGRNPSMPLDEPGHGNLTAFMSFASKLKFIDTDKYLIYIATDSNQVREEARRLLPNYININRTIVHLAPYSNHHSTSELCDGYYTALFEQYLLTRCNYLFISRSNFGVNAAHIRGFSNGLYLYSEKVQAYKKAHSIGDISKAYHFH